MWCTVSQRINVYFFDEKKKKISLSLCILKQQQQQRRARMYRTYIAAFFSLFSMLALPPALQNQLRKNYEYGVCED